MEASLGPLIVLGYLILMSIPTVRWNVGNSLGDIEIEQEMCDFLDCYQI